MTTAQNFISILKQQLSTSLQVVSNSEEETVTTQLPSTWLAEQPRTLGVGRTHRLNSLAQPPARTPKSNSSILSSRASVGRKFLSKSPHSISEREKRLNIQRLMYDPRRKLGGRTRRGASQHIYFCSSIKLSLSLSLTLLALSSLTQSNNEIKMVKLEIYCAVQRFNFYQEFILKFDISH